MKSRNSVQLHQWARDARARVVGDLLLRAWNSVTGFITQRYAKPRTFRVREYYPWP